MVSKDNDTRSTVGRRPFLKTAALGAGSVFLAGCSGGGNNNNSSSSSSSSSSSGGTTGSTGSSKPINIGGLLQLSGIYAEYGKPFRAGMKYGIKEVNDNGGVLSRKMNLVSADNGDSPKKAQSNFLRFIDQNNVVATAGPAGVQVTQQTASVAEKQQVPIYMMAANFPIFVNGTDTRYAFNPGLVSIKNWIRPQGEWAKQKGYDKVGVIYQNGLFEKEVSWAIDHYFPSSIELHHKTAPPNSTDYTSQLRTFPKDIEFFVGTGHPAHAYQIYSNLYDLGFDPKVFAAGINPLKVGHDVLKKSADKSWNPFSVIDATTDKFASTAKKFYKFNGEYFDTTAAQGYSVVKMIAKSIEQAGSADPTKIANQTRDGKFDLLNATPIQFHKWGELKDSKTVFYDYHTGSAPSWYPKGTFTVSEAFRSSTMTGMTPTQAKQTS